MARSLQESANREDKARQEMRTVVAVSYEPLQSKSGFFHLLTDDGNASLCGLLNEVSDYAADVAETLPRRTAVRLGLSLCGRCSIIAESREGGA